MPERVVVIEAFAEEQERLEEQAAILTELTIDEHEWLARARPDTLANFSNEELALRSMRRIRSAETIDGYLFRDARVDRALGIGTIVSKLCIHDPRSNWLKTVTADQIDIWASSDATEREQVGMSRQLLGRVETDTALAILTDDELERARGVPLTMPQLGNRAPVRVPIWIRRDYGLRQRREPMNIFMTDRPHQFAENR